MAEARRETDLQRRVRKARKKARAQLNIAKQLAKLAADDPRVVRDLAKGAIASRKTATSAKPKKNEKRTAAAPAPAAAPPTAAAAPTRTEPAALASFDRT